MLTDEITLITYASVFHISLVRFSKAKLVKCIKKKLYGVIRQLSYDLHSKYFSNCFPYEMTRTNLNFHQTANYLNAIKLT